MKARCHDTLAAIRCEKPLAHDGKHVGGGRFWDVRPVPVAPWRAHLTSRDNTRAVLTGGPL